MALLALGSATGHAQRTGMLGSQAAAPVVSGRNLRRRPALAAAIRAAVEAAAQQAATPTMTAGPDGFVMQSASGDYRLQIGLLVHADGRFALGDDEGDVCGHLCDPARPAVPARPAGAALRVLPES